MRYNEIEVMYANILLSQRDKSNLLEREREREKERKIDSFIPV